MRVFITGATGHVGTAVTNELIANGHEVVGLARSEASAAKLEAAGAGALRGELADLDTLAKGAREADAVIHCGFIHDFSQYAASVETDRVAIETFGTALKGTDKPLLVTAGLAGVAPGRLASEEDVLPADFGRASETVALRLAGDGIKAMVVRLPPSTHGRNDHGFVASLIQFARDKGAAAYVGEGTNHWSAGHVLDAARLYRLALEGGTAGARYHAVGDEGIAFRDIAAVIGRRLGLPVQSVSADEAGEYLSWLAPFAQFDAQASSALTRERLGWAPQEVGLLDDMEEGTYF